MVWMAVSTPSCPTCVCWRWQWDVTLPNWNWAWKINKFRVKQQIDRAKDWYELIQIIQEYYWYDISQIINDWRELSNWEFLGICQNVLSVTNKKIKELIPKDPDEFLQSNQPWNWDDHRVLLAEEVE